MSGHTPGPWVWRGNQLYSPTAQQTLLRDITFWNLTEADKASIAAAPDLLAACKQAAGVLSGEVTHKQGLVDALESIRAALLKASGGGE